ncbi:MAG: glycosyltransferase family 61 protein [Oscillatoriales cyanobacterium]|jgi:hypothetical protein|nr:MAG: glycosyltransferase family 61 protein [Oscillatoriales cyanobacterium]TAH23951.1 MAG: glycosyltransferase family 61 protein [Oscillatoriales cyanobacterium]
MIETQPSNSPQNPALLSANRKQQLIALKASLVSHEIPPSSSNTNPASLGEKLNNFILTTLESIPIFRLLQLKQILQAKDSSSKNIENFQVLFPPERVDFTPNQIDRNFLDICLYYNNDYFDRSEIFVCDVVPAYVHIGTGTICTKDFEVVVDSGMEYRLTIFRWRQGYLHRLKLLWAKPIPDLSVHIFSLSAENFWHFLYDSLPRIYSTIIARPTQKLTVLVPNSLSTTHRELLECVLPANFNLIYIQTGTWVRVERLVMPSFVSRMENGFLPSPYYEYLRNCVFNKLDLSPIEKPTERIYISRANAKHRRVLNEDQVIKYLAKFGFKTVFLEDMSFREQVDLFIRAEIIVAPHGAGLGTTIFSGKIKIFVLYPESSPTPFFFTQFKGLGQEHYFLTHGKFDEDADFEVDLSKFEQVLQEQIKLQPC